MYVSTSPADVESSHMSRSRDFWCSHQRWICQCISRHLHQHLILKQMPQYLCQYLGIYLRLTKLACFFNVKETFSAFVFAFNQHILWARLALFLGHYSLKISFSSGVFPKQDASRRILPLCHYNQISVPQAQTRHKRYFLHICTKYQHRQKLIHVTTQKLNSLFHWNCVLTRFTLRIVPAFCSLRHSNIYISDRSS